jgi:hypothetical protein
VVPDKNNRMPPESVGTMRLEDLKVSENQVGQIFPVIKDQYGNILDGFHRKRVDPDWKETVVEVKDALHGLRIRVHANTLRRDVPWSEKNKWVLDARALLNPDSPTQVNQDDIANALGMSQQWVSKYDNPLPRHGNVDWRDKFLGYNVWGFKDESWRKLIAPAPVDMPDTEFYHGTTPPFVVHQLIKMFTPKRVLDSMAGIGTTGYVCKQYESIAYDLYDLYPYPKAGVEQSDAEFIQTEKKYDLIFNHIPYLDMVKYGEDDNDLSGMSEKDFWAKMTRIFLKNHSLLNTDGIYAVLVGDKRFGGEIKPLMAKTTTLGLATGFKILDEAITITSGHKQAALQEYRASEHGYLAQIFDMIIIFRRI